MVQKKDRYLTTKISNVLRKYGYTVLHVQDYEEQVKKDIGNLGELLVGNLGPSDADVTILAGDDLINLIDKLNRKNHR